MLGRNLEVALIALVAGCLLVPLVWGAARRVRNGWPPVGDDLRRRWAGRIGGTLFALAVVNFLAYSVHAGELGGSAYRGEPVAGWRSVSADGQEYTEGNGPAPVRADGRYYVAAHGRYTKVTERQWRAVRAHEVSVYITHPLGLLVGGALLAYSQRWWGRQPPAERGASPDGGGK